MGWNVRSQNGNSIAAATSGAIAMNARFAATKALLASEGG